MLVLFETPAGFAIFKVLDEKKIQETENLYTDFQTPERASKIIKLKQFAKFADTTEALASATAAVEGKMSKTLKKMLKKLVDSDMQEELAVADAKLGSCIKEKLNLSCVSNSSVQELMRCIRSQMDSLITGLDKKDISAMALGLAHSLSRYKLKFSPDKVDTMIVQAVSLLDDLDKELNNYIMRCKEWYGWHFPELGKIILDNVAYIKTVKAIGTRDNAIHTDLSTIISEELENQVKETAEISMGTEIAEEDIMNIHFLCDQVLEMSLYRSELYEYLKNRMMAIAPNLTILVGELIGARLIAHAGSLLNLAKHPASTVQILGAEKALFRALKTRHDTPKYGLIYHAQLVGQCSVKLKGKMSRMLAAKTSLACRVDALGEDSSVALGTEHRARLEARLKQLEDGSARRISGLGKSQTQFKKYISPGDDNQAYLSAADSTIPLKRKQDFESDDGSSLKKRKVEVESGEDAEVPAESSKKKKKQKKRLSEEPVEELVEETPTPKKKKKKKQAKEVESDADDHSVLPYTPASSKKKKAVEDEPEAPTPKSKKKKKKKLETSD